MIIKLNKQYDLFIECARHVYKYWEKNKKAHPVDSFEESGFLGFKRAKNLSLDLIDTIDSRMDFLWYTKNGMTEREWIAELFEEDRLYSFYDEFICKNQKLWVEKIISAQ